MRRIALITLVGIVLAAAGAACSNNGANPQFLLPTDAPLQTIAPTQHLAPTVASTAAGKLTSTPKSPTPAPLGHDFQAYNDRPEEVAYQLAVLQGHCFADNGEDALNEQSPYGCDDAMEFAGIVRRLGEKCTESGPRKLADELVAGHQIVHDHGYPHVSLLDLGHNWDFSIPTGLRVQCVEILAALIATAYP